MKSFLLLSYLLISNLSFAGFIVVSDFDDTIKHTNVSSPVDMARNVFTRKAFSGMPTLLNNMRTYASKTFILTSSPSIIRYAIVDLLNKHKILYDGLTTNSTLNRPSSHDYKTKAIKDLMKEYPKDEFILIGDDGGQDPEIYDEIKRLFPKRIAAIYIHQVKNRELPSSVIPYITAFDVSLWEMHFERMGINNAKSVLERVENPRAFKYLIPSFAYCPKDNGTWMSYPNTELAIEFDLYQNKITETCNQE